jgi:hypothetical protein
VLALPLRDFHALREVMGRLGAIAVSPAEVECRNCDRSFEVELARAPAQDVADRLDDDAEEPWKEAREVRVGGRSGKGRRARRVTLREVTVGEVRAYWRALARPGHFDVTPALVRAMGIARLGEVAAPGPIARELSGARDAVWDAIEAAFDALAYDPRLFLPAPCPHCGAIHELVVPYDRETGGGGSQHAQPLPPSLASADAFESLVHRLGAEIWKARDVAGVSLRVEPGVPDVDDAGEPLLGSYVPGDERLVTVYYKSFEKTWRDDGAYDVEAEVRETLEHELTHHFHDLEGHDPLDEEERAEVRRDVERTYGKAAVRRAVRRAWLVNAAVVVALVTALALVLFLLDRLGVLH